jgi:peptidoglycan/LPS O-acetylase OafA/YrhL
MLLLYETRHTFVKPKHPVGKFISWCGRHSYRIYLWQGMVASIPFLFVPALLERGVPSPVIFLISLTWMVSVSASITYGHNWLMSANSMVRKMNDWIEQD